MAGEGSTSRPELTREIAINAIRDFFRDTPFVVFGTGTSCALDVRFGMSALQTELRGSIENCTLTQAQKGQWRKAVESLESGRDLESSLDSVTDPMLLRIITMATGKFVALLDRDYGLRIAAREIEWPATRLVRRLVDTLPEGTRALHALTPNYDTLFEHACDSLGTLYVTGYTGGIAKRLDWRAAEQSLLVSEPVQRGRRITNIYKHRKHIRLYKVHGSLNCFHHNDEVVTNDSWMWDPPEEAERVIITPGLSKYEKLQRYRQELLQVADAAIEKATNFLFLGYGFNDQHLEEYIRRKLIGHACRGLIVTRDSNPRIEQLVDAAPHLWLICKTQDQSAGGTRIRNKQYSGWLTLPSLNLWQFTDFTAHLLGA